MSLILGLRQVLVGVARLVIEVNPFTGSLLNSRTPLSKRSCWRGSDCRGRIQVGIRGVPRIANGDGKANGKENLGAAGVRQIPDGKELVVVNRNLFLLGRKMPSKMSLGLPGTREKYQRMTMINRQSRRCGHRPPEDYRPYQP